MSKTVNSCDKLSPPPKKSPDLISTHHENISEAVAQLNGLQVIHATTGRVRICTIEGSYNSICVSSKQDLLNLEPPTKIAYSVVHKIAGRIRFHVPRIASDAFKKIYHQEDEIKQLSKLP